MDTSRVTWRGPLGANHSPEHAYPTPTRNMLSAARRRDRTIKRPPASEVRIGFRTTTHGDVYEMTLSERQALAQRRSEDIRNAHIDRQERRAATRTRVHAQMVQIDTWADHH